MEKRSPIDLTWVVVAAVVLLAAVGGVALLWWSGAFGRSEHRLPDAFRYDPGEVKRIDPALIKYRQTAAIPVTFHEARAVAVGPEDRVYVAGDRAIAVFDAKGGKRAEFALPDEPRCLAVAGATHASPGRIYVGMKNHVEVLDAAGKRLAAWEDLGAKANLTSIAVGPQDVFVADAGNRIVYRYDPAGKRLAEIGKRDPAKDTLGFIIPSPHFDLALTADARLRVANPGRHRIEGYSADGTLEGYWGESGTQTDRFCGCCNPASFAILPDGRFVTAEKGLPRVKVYREDGAFDCVVAGPETFATTATILEETRDELRLPVLDVAADAQGRVLVLDPAAGKVRVFEPKPPAASEKKGT